MQRIKREISRCELRDWSIFLFDSIGKLGLNLEGETDGDIEKQKSIAENYIKENNLPSELINGMMQMPTNIAVARKYLEYYLEEN